MHAQAACESTQGSEYEIGSAGGTNIVKMHGFLPVLRENVNTSRFSAKVKSIPAKLRFSFRQVTRNTIFAGTREARLDFLMYSSILR